MIASVASSQTGEEGIRGEGEGIFYNCTDYVPDGKKAKSYFLERMERNDPFFQGERLSLK